MELLSADIQKMFYIVLGVFGMLELAYYLYPNKIPRIKGDVYIDRGNFTIYIPLVSTLVISILLTLLFGGILKNPPKLAPGM